MPLEWAIALRYLTSSRREGGVSFVTGVAVLGVTLGVGALMVAMAVMNGYQTNLLKAMAGALPHVSLYPLSNQGFADEKEVLRLVQEHAHPRQVSPLLSFDTLVRKAGAPDAPLQGVTLRGVEPEAESQVPFFLAYVDDGSPGWSALSPGQRQQRARALVLGLADAPPGTAPVLISPTLAAKLGVGLGDALSPLEFPAGAQGFAPLPLPGRLVVRGFFQTGILAFDDVMLILPLEKLRQMVPADRLEQSLGVRLDNPLDASRVAQELRDASPTGANAYHVYSWLETNKGLFQVIAIQRVMLYLVLMLIVTIAFFGMISALVMLVVEKTREITILKSLGAQNVRIRRVFLIQGLLIGLLGAVLGLLLGLGVCWVLDTFPLLTIPPGVYPGSDRVPVHVALPDIAWVLLGTLVVCLAATQWPARKAVRIKPVEGLRFG